MPTSPAERGLRTFLDHLRIERGVSPHTAAAYGRDLARYVEFLASQGVDDLARVRTEHVSAFTRALTDGDAERPALAPSSVARALAAVRSLSRFAVEEGLASDNPAAEASGPKLPDHLPKALGVHEVQLLLDSCDRDTVDGLRDAALLELLYGTGGRVSEIVDLDVDDIAPGLGDPDAGLRLFGKGRKERVVPLGSYARAAVDAWLVRGRPAWAAKAKRPGPALLLNTRGDRLSRQSAWAIMRSAAQRAGIKAEVSPHTLRHSFATHLLDGGADVRVVQELLGHASVTTTQIYTKVTIDQLRDVYLSSHPRSG